MCDAFFMKSSQQHAGRSDARATMVLILFTALTRKPKGRMYYESCLDSNNYESLSVTLPNN